jgi:uncharacterized protein
MNMTRYIKYVVYLFVLIGFNSANSGSYEDFFTAIRQDDDKTVKALLSRGFDPNTRDPKGFHGLFLAVREPAPKVAITLIDWPKTDVESRTAQDESPLMISALKGQFDLASRLIERGADVNKPGWTPLHYAATNGHVAVIRLLLDKHAYIDAAAPSGTTPLMMAAHYGTPEAVKVLLEEGADPMLKNLQGLSAIDFANRAGRKESAELIAAFVRSRQPKGKW